VYPFERFTERAKKTLTLAQEEAERSHHSYIGTEHLLLGILRNQDSIGFRVLDTLGVRIDVVREVIESTLGRNERIRIQQIIPTSRVKRVIELSFEEARRMGHDYVGTEHLLLGLMIEGEGIAAHVLSDLGITLTAVRDQIERQLITSAVPEAASSSHIAGRKGSASKSDLESLEELLTRPRIAELLSAGGLDVDRLTRQLHDVPELVLNLRRHLSAMTVRLAEAVKDADYEHAAQMKKVLDELSTRLREAEQDWLDALTRPPDSA
jgi:ATP-dependent Clp protease ATP-binding subunit ClpA